MSTVFAPQLMVTVEGERLARAAEQSIDEVVVEDHLHLPGMFSLRFRSSADDLLDDAGLDIGTKVAISLQVDDDESTDTPIMEAEVTGIEATLGSLGSHIVVRGYDVAHRLHRARVTKAWKNMTDSDIAMEIAQAHGITIGDIDSSSTTHEVLGQPNATDWEFLRARAREIGYEVGVRGGRFHFTKALTTAAHLQPPLTMGEGLLSFSPRISSAIQVSKSEVRGWDPDNKMAIVGSADASTHSASLSSNDPLVLAAAFGSNSRIIVDRPVSGQGEADAIAASLADSLASTFVEAEGVARGDPRLRAGAAVRIEGAGRTFDGDYVLTSTRHVWDTDEGYLTHLVISGRHDRSLLGLATVGAAGGPMSGVGPLIHGMVVGTVSNVKDPKNEGRVKLLLPWLSDNYETDWARTLQAGAGSGHGLFVIPEVNSEVLVAFDHGDVRCPYVLGGLYNGSDTPGVTEYVEDSTGAIIRRGLVSRTGHTLLFLDDDQAPGITLATRKKLCVELRDGDTTVHISSEGKVLIESKGEVTVTAKGPLSLKSEAEVSIEGATLSLKAQGQATLQASGEVAVKGAIVRIN